MTGIDLVEVLPYVATLNGPDLPIDVPEDVAEQFPPRGTPVTAGSVSAEVPFDPADPTAVFVWLLGNTDVTSIRGPHLAPLVTGDIIGSPDGEAPPGVDGLGPVTVSGPAEDTAPEALAVLHTHGVGAWRRWVREARAIDAARAELNQQ